MSLRIIAGRYKGRRLRSPTWPGLRPTSDRLRETLFNILAPRIAGARVLDGFAGTGAVGIEALSRGAAHVRFVERDRRAAALIRENLAACGVEQGYTIDSTDFAAAVRRAREQFDVIVLDPPYALGRLEEVLAIAAPALAAGGVLVIERASRRDPATPETLVRIRDVKSGDSTLTFFARRDA